jgi:hypothetical protein
MGLGCAIFAAMATPRIRTAAEAEVEKWESLTKRLCLSRPDYGSIFSEVGAYRGFIWASVSLPSAEDRQNGTEGRLHGGCFTGRTRI